VIYHGNCYDGFTAAWAFRRFKGPNADFVPINHGDDPPDCKGRMVWVLDFTFPRDVMIEKVIAPSIRTTIYDHHKTAEADLHGISDELRERGLQRSADKIVFDVSRSGAGITYDELEREAGQKAGRHTPRYNGERPCRLIDYVEDRDLWSFKWPDSKEVSAYIATLTMTFEVWDALGEKMSNSVGTREVVAMGSAVQGYIDNFGAKARAMLHWRKVGGFEVPVINVPYMNCSEHVGTLAEEHPEAPFACGFFLNSKGQWQFSLRSRPDENGDTFDVSDVAKQYGGGGHQGAAGFQVDELPWE
jgi:oligoribonuclease NrnB/cAMP/cGMP phosphodiesterase (DHH superfamily)